MESDVKSVPETRKKWVAPKLKKVDVETLTANSFNHSSGDLSTFQS